MNETSSTPDPKDIELAKLREQVRTLQEQLQAKEMQHNTLLDGLQDIVYELNLQGELIYVNAAVERILGFTPEESIGRHFKSWIAEEVWERTLASHMRALEEETVTTQSILLDKEGNPHFVEVVTARCLEAGKLIGTRGVVRDITERYKTLQALEDQQKLMQALFNAITESVIVVDRHETVVAVNKTTAERLGTTVEALVGQPAAKMMPPEVAQRRIAVGYEMIKTKKPVRLEDQRGPFTFDNMYYPIFDSENELSHIVIFARDITKERESQEQLHHFREQMSQTERLASVGTLSAMVAHELSQPLTVLRLSLQGALAQKEVLESVSFAEDLQDCMQEVEKATGIMQRFRNFARTVSTGHKEPVQVRPVIERIVRLLDYACQRVGVTINIEGGGDCSPVNSSVADLEQLFFVLIENCLQAAHESTEDYLRIQIKQLTNHLEICFEDTCGGIPKEHEVEIFEPFFTTKAETKGTGLGLCIAERVVDDIGGKITLYNRVGEGATFCLHLPFSQ